MIRTLLLLSVIAFPVLVNAQANYTISGKIIDSATREPLSGASVYCQNTTVGTTTNKQGEYVLELRSGGYDLVTTYTGYRSARRRISAQDGRIAEIELVQEDKSLGEVVVKSSSEVKDGWEKYGNFFTAQFLGSTPNAAATRLLNPQVLHFFFLKRANKLRVMADEPLQIENQALGYQLRYSLDSFVYYYNNSISTYRGFCFYTELEGSDSLKLVWTRNRNRAYEGSKLQFMRSYYDSTLTQDGFTINMLDETNNTNFYPVGNVYDTSYYGSLDSSGQVEIWYPRKISVAFAKKPEPEYLSQFKLPKDVPIQLSYIDVMQPIAILENGYYYDQKDWVNQGYWSWKNLADQLPYDFTPVEFKTVN